MQFKTYPVQKLKILKRQEDIQMLGGVGLGRVPVRSTAQFRCSVDS